MNPKRKITISEMKLKCLMDWAFNCGKNDGWEYRYKEDRNTKIEKI
jgi:hypothetical protein